MQDDDFVSHGHSLDLIMSDVDHCCLKPFVKTTDFKPHADSQCRIKVRQRFVKQEGRGLAHDRAADGNSLPLTPGQLAGSSVEIVGQIQDGSCLFDSARLFRLVHFRHSQWKTDVFAHCHMRIQGIGLKHHGESALRRWNGSCILPVDANDAVRYVFKSRDQS